MAEDPLPSTATILLDRSVSGFSCCTVHQFPFKKPDAFMKKRNQCSNCSPVPRLFILVFQMSLCSSQIAEDMRFQKFTSFLRRYLSATSWKQRRISGPDEG
jgi:hypothetical protein